MTLNETLIFNKLILESNTDRKIQPEDVCIVQVVKSENSILVWFKNAETKWDLNLMRFIIPDQDVEDYVRNIKLEFRQSQINHLIS